MAQAHSLTAATTHKLLSSTRRRHLLTLLADAGEANVEELGRQIAARERDVHPSQVSEDRQQRVTVSLVHNHVPKLAEHDVVQYDADSKTVVLMDVVDDLRRVTQQSETWSVFRKLLSGY